MKHDDYADPDDMFSDTRMTFGEHIEDLRTHLMRALKGFVLMMLLSFFFAKPILHFITSPVEAELQAYHQRYQKTRGEELARKIAAGQLEIPKINVPVVLWPKDAPRIEPKANEVMGRLVPALLDWLRDLDIDNVPDPRPEAAVKGQHFIMQFPDALALDAEMKKVAMLSKPPSLTSLSIQEPFVVFFKVSILAGFVLSSPWVFYQIWSFVAAGLYPHEKRLVNVYLPVSIVLFFAGALICQFFVIPKAIAAMLWFNELLEVQPDPRLNEWLGFAIFMPLVFGISFQTPLVMLFTFMIGVFDLQTFREKRRMAMFLMAVFAAVITPSIDAVGMLAMWVPMCLLYELGIWMCWYKGREESESLDMEESQELVEV